MRASHPNVQYNIESNVLQNRGQCSYSVVFVIFIPRLKTPTHTQNSNGCFWGFHTRQRRVLLLHVVFQDVAVVWFCGGKRFVCILLWWDEFLRYYLNFMLLLISEDGNASRYAMQVVLILMSAYHTWVILAHSNGFLPLFLLVRKA